jgi:c-di-GMP-binding flagellar brake protein YcgR
LEEKRRYNRWRLENRKATVKKESQTKEVPLVDLSSGGMKVVLEDDIAVGSKISGEFRVMPQQGSYFIHGKVIWIKNLPEESKYEVGIEFDKIKTVVST